MGRHFVSHGKLGKSGQVIKAIGNGSSSIFPDENMNIEQLHDFDAKENQFFTFPQNIQQLLVDYALEKQVL